MLVLGHELLDFLLELFEFKSNNLENVKQAFALCRTNFSNPYLVLVEPLKLGLSTLVCKSSRLRNICYTLCFSSALFLALTT